MAITANKTKNVSKSVNFPKLMEHTQQGCIILATMEDGDHIRGTKIVKGEKGLYGVGYQGRWYISNMKDYHGSLTLTNFEE